MANIEATRPSTGPVASVVRVFNLNKRLGLSQTAGVERLTIRPKGAVHREDV